MNAHKEEFAVRTVSLTKAYKGKTAVHSLDMRVREGAIYGFIGRNGAGKSTALKMLCGLARPSAGEMYIFGKQVGDPAVARRVGSLIESTGLYQNMTARQNVVMKARSMGLVDEKSADVVLDAVGLSEAGRKKTKYFSMGMKQRLGIALALLGNPDLLILDEPTNGLDPEGIREIRQLIQKLNEEGKTFIISSHILGELSRISTHYGIIKEGSLVEQIDRDELEKKCTDYFQIEVDNVKRALPLLEEEFPGAQKEVCDNRIIRLYHLKDGAGVNQLLIENQVQVYSSGFHHMDLEEYFVERMGKAEEGKEGGRKHV